MRKKKWRLKPKVKNTITVIFLFLVLGISFNIGWNVYREHVLFERLEALKENLPEDKKGIANQLLKKYGQVEEIIVVLENIEKYPDEIIHLLLKNKDTLVFAYEYLDYDGTSFKENLEEDLDTLPALYQWDTRWGYEKYGDNMMAITGCAPTSLSMILSYLQQDASLTPMKIANDAIQNGYYEYGTGTSWQLIYNIPALYGTNVREISLDKNLFKNELEANNPILMSVLPGDFTSSGHFIVLYDMDGEEVSVQDPNSKTKSEKTWKLDRLFSQCANAWVFSNN